MYFNFNNVDMENLVAKKREAWIDVYKVFCKGSNNNGTFFFFYRSC